MKAYLLAIIVLVIPSWAAPDDEPFRHKGCPVQFAVPSGWEYEVNPGVDVFTGRDKKPSGLVCTIGLRPPRWATKRAASHLELEPFPVTIAVIHRPFLKVAHDVGFRRMREIYEGWETPPAYLSGLKPDDWTVPVRQGEAPASEYRSACCQVLRGDTWGNTVAKDGSKATFNDELVVLNDRRGHSAVIETSSADEFRNVTNLVVRTFRFDVRGPN